MIAEPKHGRRLVVGATSLTRQRLPKSIDSVLDQIRNELEVELISGGLVPNEKFSWISLFIRLGLKDDIAPSVQGKVSDYGDLPLSIEVDCSRYLELSESELKRSLSNAAQKAIKFASDSVAPK